MIPPNQVDAIESLLFLLKDLLPLLKDPKAIDESLAGIAEARQVIAQKNEAVDALEKINAWEQNREAIEADLNVRELHVKSVEDNQAVTVSVLAAQEASLKTKEEDLLRLQSEVADGHAANAKTKAALAAKQAKLDAEEAKIKTLLEEAEAAKAEVQRRLNLLLEV